MRWLSQGHPGNSGWSLPYKSDDTKLYSITGEHHVSKLNLTQEREKDGAPPSWQSNSVNHPHTWRTPRAVVRKPVRPPAERALTAPLGAVRKRRNVLDAAAHLQPYNMNRSSGWDAKPIDLPELRQKRYWQTAREANALRSP